MNMSKNNKETLGSIPSKGSKKSKSKIPELEKMPAGIKDAVDTFVEEYANVKASKKTMDEVKGDILSHMDGVFDSQSDYEKSFRLIGNTEEITITKAARFSIKADKIEDLVKATDQTFVENNFKKEVSIAVNPDAFTDQKLFKKLMKKLKDNFTKEELGQFFIQSTKIVAGKDLAENIHKLPAKKRAAIRGLAIQAAAGLK